MKNSAFYRKRALKIAWLCLLVTVAMGYSSLLNFQQTLTGANKSDGIMGVLLGLFICAQPAANILEALLFGRLSQYQEPSRVSSLTWWSLNVLVLLTGWMVIIIGMTRFSVK